MEKQFRYTDAETAVIDGIISTFYPRMSTPELRQTYLGVHRRLQSGEVNTADLRRIESAIALYEPSRTDSWSHEEQREVVHLLMKTRAMLRGTS